MLRAAAVVAVLLAGSGAAAAEGPAYRLAPEYDVAAFGLGASFSAARLVRTQKAWCAPRCDERDVNGLDRLTAGRWSPTWATVSDASIVSMGALAAAYLFVDERPAHALNDAVVVAESALVATATATIMTAAVQRPRPYLYGDRAPLDVRDGVDASMSFISSHTAVAFALSTATWRTYRLLHPDAKAHWAVLLLGDVAAGVVGAARVLAGRHFVTDVVTGALVGTSVGLVVPALHAAPVQLVPTAGKDHAELSLVGRF
jgi:membrane-associated phospholipid phosphatase